MEKSGFPLQVAEEVEPQVEEFRYVRVLLTCEGNMEQEIDRRIGRHSTCGEERTEPKGDTLHLLVDLRSCPGDRDVWASLLGLLLLRPDPT